MQGGGSAHGELRLRGCQGDDKLGGHRRSEHGRRGHGYALRLRDLTGSAFNDTLTGDGGANVTDGGDGNDLIVGGRRRHALWR